MPVTIGGGLPFCGQQVSRAELELIRETVEGFGTLSLTELAATVCELLGWRRANGGLKVHECLAFLRELQTRGWLTGVPESRPRAKPAPSPEVVDSGPGEPPVTGSLSKLLPLRWQQIDSREDRRLFRRYLDAHHYLGYRVPVGAQMRFFVRCPRRNDQILACLLFTSAAWTMAPRDRWIGWTTDVRRLNLPRVVNQARFLILPWVQVPHLASRLLAEAARVLPDPWEAQYRVRPLLLESLVDAERFTGTCYRAANWIPVGLTQGRGRMDRHTARIGHAPKHIFLYPLSDTARTRLCQPPSDRKGGHHAIVESL